MSRGPQGCLEKAAEYRRQARTHRGKARDMLLGLARYWETLAERHNADGAERIRYPSVALVDNS